MMTLNPIRRTLLAVLATTAMTTPFHAFADSDAFPSKPIRWLVGYPPGGGSDTIARIVSEGMSKSLAQTVYVENRPGASANLAGNALASAPADGYTVMNPDNGLLIFNPVLYKQMGFSPSKSMKPVGGIGRLHLIIAVAPNHPAKSFKELLEMLRTQKEPVQYAASSVGSPLHLAMVRLEKDAKLNVTQIPYKGAGPAINDFLGGVVQIICTDYSSGSQYVKAGKMRPLAVISDKRIAALPNVPTVAESGFPGFEAYAWQGLVVPAGTPEPVVQKLNAALNHALKSKPVVDRLEGLGIEPTPSSPVELATLTRREEQTWQPIVRNLGITLD
jgi:tripartite-type tricarboxylate transporter receptor subunit TctC